MSTIQTITGPTSVRGKRVGTVTRIQEGRPSMLLRFQAQATDVSLFYCIQTDCGNFNDIIYT